MGSSSDRPLFLSCPAHEFGEPVALAELVDAEVRGHLDLLADQGLSRCRVAAAPPHELAVVAASRALLTQLPTEPDAVVYCCDTPGSKMTPASAVGKFAAGVGLISTPVVAVGGGGCGNLGPGLRTARGLLVAEGLSNVLLITSDHAVGDTRYLPDDLTVLSDGAAACVVGTAPLGPAFRLLGVASALDARPGGTGLAAAKAVVAGVARATRHVLLTAGLTPADCRFLVTGNYGTAVRSLLAAAAGFPRDKVHAPWVADVAHCFAADALFSLEMLLAHDVLADGDRILLLATSPRSWSAILVEHVR